MPFLGKRALFMLLGSAAVTIINLFVVTHWYGKAHYMTSQLRLFRRTQDVTVKTLNNFDVALANYTLESFTITLRAEWEGGDKASDMAISHTATVNVDFLKSFIPLLMHQLELQEVPPLLQNEPVINDHVFSYILNPHRRCVESQTDILFTVPSAPHNFEKRMAIRNDSRGSYLRLALNNAKLLFFIGRPPQSEKYLSIQQNISKEAGEFGDIVQENFEDAYKNIRFKGVSMLKWATTFCSSTRYVIRLDDDVVVNVTKLMSAMKRTHAKFDNFVLGQMRVHDKPQRFHGKVYLSYEEYPHSTFPPYALGGLLGYPISTVRLLYHAALRVRPIWLDDVFVTALCAAKVNIPVMQDPEFTFRHPKEAIKAISPK